LAPQKGSWSHDFPVWDCKDSS